MSAFSMRAGDTGRLILKTLLFTLIMPIRIAVLIPLAIALLEYLSSMIPHVVRNIGFLPLVFGAILYLWCAWDFAFVGGGTPSPDDPPKVLIVKGPYRITRNPMFVGVLLMIIGMAITLKHGAILLYAVVMFLRFQAQLRSTAEPQLRERFGPAFDEYRRRVPRWLW
jgi:protein-S-isoprenylcysteine O-methyltransferase Ste14